MVSTSPSVSSNPTLHPVAACDVEIEDDEADDRESDDAYFNCHGFERTASGTAVVSAVRMIQKDVRPDHPDDGCPSSGPIRIMRSVMRRIALLATVIFACAIVATGPAHAQPAPAPSSTPPASPSPAPSPSAPSDPCGSILSIVNRPTVSTGVCTVRTGHFDLETGYTNTTYSGTGGGSNANYPQALLRVGTADPHLDFEFGFPSAETTSVGTPTLGGTSDVSMATKYVLGFSSKADWGVYGAVTFPTGSKAFTAGNAEFTGDFDWGYTLNSEFSLAGTLSFNALSAPNLYGTPQSYFAFIPSLELSAALPGGPSQLSAEYAYFSAAGPGFGSKNLFDFVYQRDFGNHLQFDVEYGFSPTLVNGQKEQYVGAGLSFMN